MIETPPKIRRPKPQSKYQPLDDLKDVDTELMDVTPMGKSKTVFKSKPTPNVSNRDDLITFNEEGDDSNELSKGLKIGQSATPEQRKQVITLIKTYWDCFCKIGAKRTILEYEFGIDTGASQPVACRMKQYGPHEAKIMMQQIEGLLANE